MKAIIVTGATSGIGKAICSNLISKGIEVVPIARNEECLKNNYTNYIVCDLTKINQYDGIFKYCNEKNIFISGLIHCAGVCKKQKISTVKEMDFYNTFLINAYSYCELFKRLIAYEKRTSDVRCISISSITAERAYKNQLLYASSKAALNSITLSLAQEGIEKDIKSNIIEFGAVKTEMFDSLSPNYESINKHYPLGILECDEAAEIVVNYLSPIYKKMTGSVIRVDSGFSVVH